MWYRLITALTAFSGIANGQLEDIPQLGLRIAPGFEITLFADQALAPDVYSMTIDPSGRVVISSRGYIKRLVDEDGDGRADSDILIAKSSPGAMGMLFIDRQTLLTSEGGSFNRYTDPEGDGEFKPEPEKIAQFRGGEHGLHAIRKDTQGRVYLIGGNDANFRGHSGIADGNSGWIEGGALVRYSAELKDPVVLCHGFRNPYDFDFDSKGEIYTYDSDCEREFLLPWYTPTRLYRVKLGAHHGWRLPGWKRGWKRPDYYFDSVAPLVNVGRGSPTGVAVYRHTAFPPEYRDAVFYCDWTFGRIYFTHPDADLEELKDHAAGIFMESTGITGFAPTDIEVAPDGSLFVAVGGRGTTGSVYHVQVKKPLQESQPVPAGSVAKGDLRAGPPVDGGTLSILHNHGGKVKGFNLEAVRLVAGELDRMVLTAPLEKRMTFLRLLMRALGDWNLNKPSREAFAGYELAGSEIFEQEHAELLGLCRNSPRALLHALDADERREAARLSAMLRDPHPITAGRMLDAITRKTSPQDDFHYLCCLACINAPLKDKEVERIANAILYLDVKTAGLQMRTKQTYVDRLNEVVARIAQRSPLYEALCRCAGFARPNHAGMAAAFPQPFFGRAAEVFFAAVQSMPAAGWGEDVIGLFEHMQAEVSTPVLRRLAAQPGLRDECVRLLARAPQETDRHLLLSAATSPREKMSRIAVHGLGKLSPKAGIDELIGLFGSSAEDAALPLIGRAAGQVFTDRKAAEEWLMTVHPDAALAVGLTDGRKQDDWPVVFSKVDWSAGDPARGRELFALRACAACHQSATALGPDLSGVAKRFSPVDLFTAIVLPDADVPPAYRVSVFTMKDGSKHIGRIAFTSADGVIIRTGTTTTVRLDESDIAAQNDWAGSLMPKGLLTGLDPLQLADLYSYLKTL
jgi:putative heme-binding domain-containing protein